MMKKSIICTRKNRMTMMNSKILNSLAVFLPKSMSLTSVSTLRSRSCSSIDKPNNITRFLLTSNRFNIKPKCNPIISVCNQC